MAELYADSTDEEIDAELAATEARRAAMPAPPAAATPIPVPQPDAEPVPEADYTDTVGATAILGKRQDTERRHLDAFEQKHLNIPPAKSTMTREAIMALVASEAQRQGVDPTLAMAVAQHESGFNPHARSPKGAKGVMQLMDPTAQRFKVGNPWDPEQNVPGGIAYLKVLGELFPGQPELQAAGYNAGEGAVKKYGGIPPYPETQKYVRNVLQTMSGTAPAKPAQISTPTGPPPPGRPFVDQLPASGTPQPKPAQIAADTGPRVPGFPWVDVGIIEAPGAIMGNARSVVSGAFHAIGAIAQVPGTLKEILGPMMPEGVKDVASNLSLGGIPAPAMADIWQGLGTAAESIAQDAEVPAMHKTFANKFFEAAGTMAAYWLPAISTGGGSIILPTALEALSEAQDVHKTLKDLVGPDEAAKRGAMTLAANVLVLGVTNKLGIGGQARTMLGKVLGGAIGETGQEIVQYETQRRQFWVPSSHPGAQRLKQAHGWQEADGRVYQPFDPKTVGEIAAISAILGGGVGGLQAMAFGLQAPSAAVAQQTERIQTQDTQDVAALMPQSVVRQGYEPAPTVPTTAVPSTPELALPGSAARGPTGDLVRVYHGGLNVFEKFDLAHSREGEGTNLWGPGFYFAEDPKVAGGGDTEPPAFVMPSAAQARGEALSEALNLLESVQDQPDLFESAMSSVGDDLTDAGQERYAILRAQKTRVEQLIGTGTIGDAIDRLTAESVALEQSQSEDGPPIRNLGYANPKEVDSTRVDGRLTLTYPGAPNVRPAYLDIRKPFDTTATFSPVEASRLFGRSPEFTEQDVEIYQDENLRMVGLPITEPITGAALYIRLLEDQSKTKATINADLQALGYDGIFHIGKQDGRVWIAFRPDQVIPAFEIDAMVELARQEVMQAPDESTAAAAPAPQTQTLNRWRGYLQAEGQRGGVPLPEGSAPVPPATERLAEINALIADAVALGETPSPILMRARAAVAAEVETARTAPPPIPEATSQGPPPLPGTSSPLAASLEAEAATQRTLHLRDDAGRWRIPLKRIPSTELELQDFVAQKGGIQLASETDVPGELRALISQKETSNYRLQNNRSGQTLQGMAELAAEHGFIATGDKTALLEALDSSVRQGQGIYSQQATGQVPGITDTQATEEPGAPRPLRPGPPMLPGTQQRATLVLSDAQVRMHERATSLSNFIVDDRVEFRLPNGHQRMGRVVSTDGTDVTIQYGQQGTQFTVDVLSPEMRTVRLTLTKAQLAAEAAGIVDLPRIMNEQMADLLTQPERAMTGRVRGINFDRLNTDKDTKQFIADAMAASSAFVEENRRGSISHSELLAMAQENIAKKRFSIDTLMQRQPGELFSPENVLASRLIGVSVAEELRARIQAFTDNPTPETQAAFFTFYPLATQITAQWSGLAAETARAMHAFQVNATGDVEYIESIGDRLHTTPLDVTAGEFAAHLGGLETREQMLAAITKVPTWGDLFLSGLYGVKLMMPTVDFRNIFGSGALYMWQTGVKQVAGVTSSAVSAGAATAHFFGWWHANMMMFRLWKDLSSVPMKERFDAFAQEVTSRIGFDDIAARLQTEGLTGERTITGANVRARGAMSGALGQAAGNLLAGGPIRSAMVDYVGAVLHFSGAKLNFEDLIAKVYNYVGEGWTQGYAKAMEADTPLEGAELWDFISNYAMNMEGTVKEKAKAAAFENTLTERLGPASQHLEDFLNAAPLARIAILFFRTPINAQRVTMRNGPLGIFAQKNMDAFEAGGADAALARTRIAMGSTLLTMNVVAGMMGLITGKNPGNRDARELLQEDAHIPGYSVWVPGLNRYVSYDWLGPITSMLGIGADLGAILRSGAFRDKDLAETVKVAFGAGVTAIGNNVLSQAWMSGANDLFNMWFPPQTSSMEGRGNPTWNYFTRQVQGLIPGPLGYVRKTADPLVRETYTLLESITDKIPFLSKNLPVSHNWLGYARLNKDTIGPDFLSPVQGPVYEAKPVFRELERLMSQGYLTMPDRPRRLQVGNSRIDLTAQEISDLELRIAGGDPDKTGKPGILEQRLGAVINSDAYRNRLSDTGRGEELEKRLRSQMSNARERFIIELPRLREETQRARREQRQQRYQSPDGTVGTIDRPMVGQ